MDISNHGQLTVARLRLGRLEAAFAALSAPDVGLPALITTMNASKNDLLPGWEAGMAERLRSMVNAAISALKMDIFSYTQLPADHPSGGQPTLGGLVQAGVAYRRAVEDGAYVAEAEELFDSIRVALLKLGAPAGAVNRLYRKYHPEV